MLTYHTNILELLSDKIKMLMNYMKITDTFIDFYNWQTDIGSNKINVKSAERIENSGMANQISMLMRADGNSRN